MSKSASTPMSCNSLLLSSLTTGPRQHVHATASCSSLGIVPVSPQRTGTLENTLLRRSLSTSAFALCTSSTITHTTWSKNCSMSIGASPFFDFLDSMDRLCQVQMVCVFVYSFLSPNSTPTSKPKFL